MELLPNETINKSSITVTGLTKEELAEWKKTRLPLLKEELRKRVRPEVYHERPIGKEIVKDDNTTV